MQCWLIERATAEITLSKLHFGSNLMWFLTKERQKERWRRKGKGWMDERTPNWWRRRKRENKGCRLRRKSDKCENNWIREGRIDWQAQWVLLLHNDNKWNWRDFFFPQFKGKLTFFMRFPMRITNPPIINPYGILTTGLLSSFHQIS